MPVVDSFLHSLIKFLQRKQKQRIKKRKKKKQIKAKAKRQKSLAKKRAAASRKRKKTPPKKRTTKRPGIRRKKAVKQNIFKKSKSKRPVRKPVKKKTVKSKRNEKSSNEVIVGVVTHYFSKIKVIVLKVTGGKLQVGEKIHIRGKTTDFTQNIKSLQMESVDVKTAQKGQLVGLKVNKKAKEGDQVYKVL